FVDLIPERDGSASLGKVSSQPLEILGRQRIDTLRPAEDFHERLTGQLVIVERADRQLARGKQRLFGREEPIDEPDSQIRIVRRIADQKGIGASPRRAAGEDVVFLVKPLLQRGLLLSLAADFAEVPNPLSDLLAPAPGGMLPEGEYFGLAPALSGCQAGVRAAVFRRRGRFW